MNGFGIHFQNLEPPYILGHSGKLKRRIQRRATNKIRTVRSLVHKESSRNRDELTVSQFMWKTISMDQLTFIQESMVLLPLLTFFLFKKTLKIQENRRTHRWYVPRLHHSKSTEGDGASLSTQCDFGIQKFIMRFSNVKWEVWLFSGAFYTLPETHTYPS